MSTDPRREAVDSLRSRPTARVLIIGGGINGIAACRDLALQGLDVVLVDRGDFVSGASSASSHMVHGGIRYLENGEFRLVRESVVERNALLRLAPHYVRPLETTVPIFSTFSGILNAPLRFLTHRSRRSGERGAILIKVGLTIYDLFSRDGGAVPRHRFRMRRRALRDLPALNPRLRFTATYFDASMHDPERLAIDVLQDAIATGRARALNHVEAVGATADGVHLRDQETGEIISVAADIVVNATGQWTDLTNSALGTETRFMGGTKGSHIVLDNPELLAATGGREIFFEHSDRRIVLIYPLKGRVMVGTTDSDADPTERPVATDDEIEYFFDLIAHVFPGLPVSRSQIVYTFSGIRPLPRHDDISPGFVSRDYRLEHESSAGTPTISVVGGKWTTFRALAEHLTDEVLGVLGGSRIASTRELPIGGGAGYPLTPEDRGAWIADHRLHLEPDRAEVLLERYGTRAADLIIHLTVHGDVPLVHAPEYSGAELAWIAQHEHVVHLGDLVLRRTSIAFRGGVTLGLLHEIAEVVGNVLGWSISRRSEEVEALSTELRDWHGSQVTAAAEG